MAKSINFTKLVLHNLTVPMERRIAADDLEQARQFAPMRGNLAVLQMEVHRDVAPELDALREKEIAVENL